MKKYIIIIVFVLISLIVSFFDINVFITDINLVIQTLFNLLALSMTAYTFIFSPLSTLCGRNEKKSISKEVDVLLKSLEDNIKTIFLTIVILIIIDIFLNIDIPLLSNPQNIDFGLFNIYSLKMFLVKLFTSFFTILSIYAFYDISKAMFLILRGTLSIMGSIDKMK